MVLDDLLPQLPVVSEEAVREYLRRRSMPEYLDKLIRRIEEENADLFHVTWGAGEGTIEDRQLRVATLVQTYALLEIQAELDSRKQRN